MSDKRSWFLRNFSWSKFVVTFIVIWLAVFFIFNDRIMESKIARTKMDAFKGIMEADSPAEAIGNVKYVIDTALLQDKIEKDSLKNPK